MTLQILPLYKKHLHCRIHYPTDHCSSTMEKRSMLIFCLLLPTLLGAPAESEGTKGKVWAVLVAGSSDWYNYSQQSNICHAYQILHRHGIPDSNIIVMMYDDIANNPSNPTPGVIINKPGGPNVYPGVLKDYTGDQVTTDNFINILTGNKEAMKGVGSGKVLESGPDDHVFVYFSDHGSTGFICFPNDNLYADDLIKTLKTMHEKKMYQKLVFYLEACESGSMFSKILPQDINIFATTAAKPDELAWMCYFDDKLKTYLGAEYGCAWMEDIDSEEHHKGLLTETLMKQYRKVVKRVKKSHPSKYGELSLGKDHVTDYMGTGQKGNYLNESTSLETFHDSVSGRDVFHEILSRRIELAENRITREELVKQKEELLKGRKKIDQLFHNILARVVRSNVDAKTVENSHQPLSLEMMPCYKTLVENFTRTCINVHKNTYVLGHMYKLANLCVMQYSSTDILQAISAECGHHYKNLFNVH